jgi:hypothetical protein
MDQVAVVVAVVTLLALVVEQQGVVQLCLMPLLTVVMVLQVQDQQLPEAIHQQQAEEEVALGMA